MNFQLIAMGLLTLYEHSHKYYQCMWLVWHQVFEFHMSISCLWVFRFPSFFYNYGELNTWLKCQSILVPPLFFYQVISGGYQWILKVLFFPNFVIKSVLAISCLLSYNKLQISIFLCFCVPEYSFCFHQFQILMKLCQKGTWSYNFNILVQKCS